MIFTVHKIGGSILANEQGFRILDNIYNDSTSKSAVIISAIGKTSANLESALYDAEQMKLDDAIDKIEIIIKHHLVLAKSLLEEVQFLTFENEISVIYQECTKILKSISITNEVSNKTYDRFLAIGEDLALLLVRSYFFDKDKVSVVDSRNMIITNSVNKKASILFDETNIALKCQLSVLYNTNNTIILQGFVGADLNGITTTMGFESSNLTATMLANFLDADELAVWTDVDGIYNADPKEFNDAKLIREIDYSTAYKAAIAGLKLIYPEMISIAEQKQIQIKYRNGLVIDENYTLITECHNCSATLIIKNEVASSNEIIITIINPPKLEILDFLIKYYPDSISKSEVSINTSKDVGIMEINIYSNKVDYKKLVNGLCQIV